MSAFFLRIAFILGFPLLFVLGVSCSSTSEDAVTKKVAIQKTTKGYQIFRNGEPFYIKGASGNSRLFELKAAGGNTIRFYDTLDLEKKLTLADSLELAVVVDIPLQIKNFTVIDKNATAWVGKFVNKYKDHPSLLFWMLGNEVYYPKFFSSDVVTSFNAIVDHIHTLDPNHPVSTAV